MNINVQEVWPPGSLMVYDNRGVVAMNGSPVSNIHFGLGMVVANDGEGLSG